MDTCVRCGNKCVAVAFVTANSYPVGRCCYNRIMDSDLEWNKHSKPKVFQKKRFRKKKFNGNN